MKHTNRLFAFLLAMIMVLGLAVSASAVDITIDDGAITGASYKAYKLMDATNASADKTLFTYVVNETYRGVLAEALNLTNTEADPATDKEIIDAISALNTDDLVRDFADDVYALVKNMTADETASNNVFAGVDQGYYLIVESGLGNAPVPDGATQAPTDTYSLVMLDTHGLDSITVTTKEEIPTVEKIVEEVNDSTGATSWGESADHDIGDTVNFEITGTVSDRYASYTSYAYQFSDTMQQGLTMIPGSIVITIDNVPVTDQFYIYTNTQGFEAYTDLKVLDTNKTNVSIDADTEIVLTYSATLNENALLGPSGNKNEVVLYYQNNPYVAGDPNFDPSTPPPPTPPDDPPGHTPPDIAIVFTFEGKVNKVDANNQPLPGAAFTLYKKYTNDTKPTGVTLDSEGYGVVVAFTAGSNTVFSFPGLDVGEYKLVETSAPAGYNKADDIVFKVAATYNNSVEPAQMLSLTITDKDGNTISSGTTPKFTIEMEQNQYTGVFTTNIVNNPGTELPSTGGMGTTILYIAGGILVLAAIVLLVTKKRMAVAE